MTAAEENITWEKEVWQRTIKIKRQLRKWEDATSSPPMWIRISSYTWNRVNNKPWATNTQQDLPDYGYT